MPTLTDQRDAPATPTTPSTTGLAPVVSGAAPVLWQRTEVSSPELPDPVAVIAARQIPYIEHANRLQNVNLYLPLTADTERLVGTPAYALPGRDLLTEQPRYHVHIHGGAWRDPYLTSSSIEPAVAHAFSDPDGAGLLHAIASINYTITKFPTHPTLPYDPIRDNHADPAREAVHPQHVSDALHGFALLRSLGLTDGSYVLSGHSCGACISFQSVLQGPAHWGLEHLPDAPRPAAHIGLNGLYDLPALVHALGPSHEAMSADYQMFQSNAFGEDQTRWPAASPALFELDSIAQRVQDGRAPSLVLLDQSEQDQLVPVNQRERLQAHLEQVDGMRVVQGHRLTGAHAQPWEGGSMIWQSVQDALRLLREA